MQLLIEDAEKIELISLRTGAPSDEEFEGIWDKYPDFRVELSDKGELIILPSCAPEVSHQNCRITSDLDAWARLDGKGIVFDSSAYFYLPTGARLSPDASWIRKSRIPSIGQQRPWSLCPDFVIELRSASDRMPRLKTKMREWMDAGAELAWLIDPRTRTVTIYRAGRNPELLAGCTSVTGEGHVAGFELKLEAIFDSL